MKIGSVTCSVTNSLNSSGGFDAGSYIVVDHQRINGTSFVFSVAVPALRNIRLGGYQHPSEHLSTGTLQENVRRIRAVLDCVDAITTLKDCLKVPKTASPVPRDAMSFKFDIAGKEYVLQDIIDNMLAHGMRIARAHCLRRQELVVEARLSILLAVTAALSRKECERAAGSSRVRSR
jgi:serine palmitoyltransferase